MRYDGPRMKNGKLPSRKTAEAWRKDILSQLDEVQQDYPWLDECETSELYAELNELNFLLENYDKISRMAA